MFTFPPCCLHPGHAARSQMTCFVSSSRLVPALGLLFLNDKKCIFFIVQTAGLELAKVSCVGSSVCRHPELVGFDVS